MGGGGGGGEDASSYCKLQAAKIGTFFCVLTMLKGE